MAESGEEKGRKKKWGGVEGGRFYEVDAALVCDELAGFLVNLTRDLSFYPSPSFLLSLSLARSFSPFRRHTLYSALLFYNLPRANGTASYFFITSNDPSLLPPLSFFIAALNCKRASGDKPSLCTRASRALFCNMNDVAAPQSLMCAH